MAVLHVNPTRMELSRLKKRLATSRRRRMALVMTSISYAMTGKLGIRRRAAFTTVCSRLRSVRI